MVVSAYVTATDAFSFWYKDITAMKIRQFVVKLLKNKQKFG